MIATSMALLSTGTDLVSDKEVVGLLDERRSEERASSEVKANPGKDVRICDGNLLLDASLLLEPPSTSTTGHSFGNFSPVYSPVSIASADSGLGGGLTSPTVNDTFLAELFGSDFPLLSQCSSTAIATTTTTSESAPAVSSQPSAAQVTSNASLTSSFFLKHLHTERSQESTAEAAKVKESEVERNRKNAEAARQNRLKKKRYMEELEKEHSDMKRESVILKAKCHEFQQRCQRLQAEVEYLKNVIANESMLSSLIQNIPNVPNVNLSSSLSSKKRPPADSSNVPTPASKRSKTTRSTGAGK